MHSKKAYDSVHVLHSQNIMHRPKYQAYTMSNASFCDSRVLRQQANKDYIRVRSGFMETILGWCGVYVCTWAEEWFGWRSDLGEEAACMVVQGGGSIGAWSERTPRSTPHLRMNRTVVGRPADLWVCLECSMLIVTRFMSILRQPRRGMGYLKTMDRNFDKQRVCFLTTKNWDFDNKG